MVGAACKHACITPGPTCACLLFTPTPLTTHRTATDNESKWRQLGELALANGQLPVARRCFERAKDLGGLLLLHSSHGDGEGMDALAVLAGAAPAARGACWGAGDGWHRSGSCGCSLAPSPALASFGRLIPSCTWTPPAAPRPPPLPPIPVAEAAGRQNIAFVCHFLRGRLDACVDLLLACGRLPEAAFFARTYAPSRVTEVRGPEARRSLVGLGAMGRAGAAFFACRPGGVPAGLVERRGAGLHGWHARQLAAALLVPLPPRSPSCCSPLVYPTACLLPCR